MEKVWDFLNNGQANGMEQILSNASVAGGFQFQTNSTYAVINHLKFQTAKSVRTSGIILASFNAAIALATALGIFWDSYKVAKRADPRFQFR